MIKAGIIGDYDPASVNHLNTDAALQHAAASLSLAIETEWLPTDKVKKKDLPEYDLLWCATGSPYKSMEGALLAIRYAREHNVPFIGTCGGFQHAVIEFARNVKGVKDARHAEYDASGGTLLITPLECVIAGQTLEVILREGSIAYESYGRQKHIREQYHCRYGLNPAFKSLIDEEPMSVTGLDKDLDVRIIEHTENDFFVATLFVPQSQSSVENPHPLIVSLIEAADAYCRKRKVINQFQD